MIVGTTVRVDARCTACGLCLMTCPERALQPAPRRPLVIDDRCTLCLACIEVCPVDAIHPIEPVHPIEAESYRRLEVRVDLSRYPEAARAVVARVIHATADLDYADTMVVGSEAVAAGVEALGRGVPVICDVEMVRAGVQGAVPAAASYLGEVGPAARGDTRSAAAMRTAADRHPDGAVVVVGCAPTALDEVIRLAEAGSFRPAIIIGLPVGFVGAAESKARLRASVLADRSISNVGERGGSAAAAAALNAIDRLARAAAAEGGT